jgi:hypothetical protein
MARDNGIFVTIVQVLGESIDERVMGRVVPSVYPTALPALLPVAHYLLPLSRLTQASDVSLFVLPDDVIFPRRVWGNLPILECLI